jgi:two-component system response regulator RegA
MTVMTRGEPKTETSIEPGDLLLVEDDELLADRLASALAERGFRVFTARSVAAALEAIATFRPQFALVDVRLSDGSGLDVVRAVRKARPSARIVVASGYASLAVAVSATKLGADDVLTKPVDADEIADSLLAPKGALPPPPAHPLRPEDKEWELIRTVLSDTGNNLSDTARRLSMHRRTLQRILRRHQIGAMPK